MSMKLWSMLSEWASVNPTLRLGTRLSTLFFSHVSHLPKPSECLRPNSPEFYWFYYWLFLIVSFSSVICHLFCLSESFYKEVSYVCIWCNFSFHLRILWHILLLMIMMMRFAIYAYRHAYVCHICIHLHASLGEVWLIWLSESPRLTFLLFKYTWTS